MHQVQSPPLPLPEPVPPPLFSYLQSLFVVSFDFLMGNANGRADYMSTDMLVRRLSPFPHPVHVFTERVPFHTWVKVVEHC